MTEALKAKETFKKYATNRGVIICHYHADNERFANTGWLNHVQEKGQTILFCGTHSHHQNGTTEERIRDLQEAARTSLIHTKRRWSNAIDTHLWPYALRLANHVHSHTISLQKKKLPINLFSQIKEVNEVKDFHTFRCLVNVLDAELQAGKHQRSR